MKIYLMRHGHAEANGMKPDEERELTPEGVERVQKSAAILAKLGIAPIHIYSSPRVRARQTADIVASALGKTIEIREEVNFQFDVNKLRHFVVSNSSEDDLMFVGHEPTMSAVIAGVTGAEVKMKPGSLARIDIDTQQSLRGRLTWLIAPKVFDALAED